MRRLILLAALCTAVGTGRSQQSDAVESILQQIENNNPELQADQRLTQARKWENRSGNNLPDPTVSYSHLWSARDHGVTEGELVVSQSFDFPTLYASRNRMNRHLERILDAEATALRQRVLLEAKTLCIDIIALHRQQQLLQLRLEQAETLNRLYRQRLEDGDASKLETNKVNLELLNARTAWRMNESALQSRMQQLLALNGNRPLTAGRPTATGPALPTAEAIGLTAFPEAPLPDNYLTLRDELLQADASLRATDEQLLAARKQLDISRQGWIPKLELGYRRNMEDGTSLNGLLVGFSIPLYENRSKVKAARLETAGISFRRESILSNEQRRLDRLYDEARSLWLSICEYRETLSHQQDLALLQQALLEGHISLIAYFVEASAIYDSQSTLIELEGNYHKALAEIYRSRL